MPSHGQAFMGFLWWSMQTLWLSQACYFHKPKKHLGKSFQHRAKVESLTRRMSHPEMQQSFWNVLRHDAWVPPYDDWAQAAEKEAVWYHPQPGESSTSFSLDSPRWPKDCLPRIYCISWKYNIVIYNILSSFPGTPAFLSDVLALWTRPWLKKAIIYIGVCWCLYTRVVETVRPGLCRWITSQSVRLRMFTRPKRGGNQRNLRWFSPCELSTEVYQLEEFRVTAWLQLPLPGSIRGVRHRAPEVGTVGKQLTKLRRGPVVLSNLAALNFSEMILMTIWLCSKSQRVTIKEGTVIMYRLQEVLLCHFHPSGWPEKARVSSKRWLAWAGAARKFYTMASEASS